MKDKLTIEQEINQAIKDVQEALLANVKANQEIIEVNRRKTTTRFTLLKAKERLASLESELMWI